MHHEDSFTAFMHKLMSRLWRLTYILTSQELSGIRLFVSIHCRLSQHVVAKVHCTTDHDHHVGLRFAKLRLEPYFKNVYLTLVALIFYVLSAAV